MKLGLIPPNSLASMMTRTELHLVVPDQLGPESSILEGLDGYVVLDNGAAEANLKSHNWLWNMCSTGFFHEVIAPDKLGNPDAALAGARSMDRFKQQFPDIQIMAVVQATKLADVMKCIAAYTAMDWIDVIGLPRVLNKQFGDRSRLSFVESLSRDGDFAGKPIHCLGAYYDFPDEIRYLSHFPLVRSMDSSLPFVLGLYGLRFTDSLPQGLLRPSDYFNIIPDDAQREAIEANVDTYINWSKAAS